MREPTSPADPSSITSYSLSVALALLPKPKKHRPASVMSDHTQIAEWYTITTTTTKQGYHHSHFPSQLLLSLDPPNPIITQLARPNIHHNNSPPPSHPLFLLPPLDFFILLLLLAVLLGIIILRIRISKTTISLLSANHQHNVVPQPRLEGSDHAAIGAGKRFLEVNDFGLDVTQDVRVTGGRGEGQDVRRLGDKGGCLLVEGGVGRVGTGIWC
ncbi:hypothetical protein QBC32DRAFT_72700 [Pseudoneurospora amorphoporcata]|uniref:Uncharacterized protein n=1 Tax=Pseudoneurospora amorphoporcata TaxID=241081 RepID=A0AAN6SBT7_9PEZI|nr:hypothetical protein QBC32DRAFT_72700 [Pseudoneurospora amorphoporcata]